MNEPPYRPEQPEPTIKGVGGAALLAFLFVAELIVGALGAYWMGWWSP